MEIRKEIILTENELDALKTTKEILERLIDEEIIDVDVNFIDAYTLINSKAEETKEKITKKQFVCNHFPYAINQECAGGVEGCPSDYGLKDDDDACTNGDCEKCWNGLIE